MATAYTSLLGLALPVTGELSGSWGDVVNDSITSLLDSAISGTTSLTTDADVTLTTTTGAANEARQAIILWNPASGTVTRNITAPAKSKIYTVINASGGTQSIVFRGAGPTTGVTIVKGESAVVAWNGTDFIKISNTGGGGSFTNVTISGTTTLSGLTASTALALNASKEVVSVTNTGTGNNVLSASPTLTGTISGANASLSGTLAVTGVATLTAQPILSSLTASRAVFTDGSKGLVSNAITGTGNVVMSASPTLTGTVAGASLQLSSLTSGRVTYAGASGLLQDSANLTFNGTDLTVSGAVNAGTINATTLDLTNLEVTNIKAKDGTAGMQIADSTGVVSFTANPVLSAATANGVVYANGSKVLTTGSALTFDGTNLLNSGALRLTGGASSNVRFEAGGSEYARIMGNGSNSLDFAVGGTTPNMRLTSTGLGIGTSSPGAKLTVVGNQINTVADDAYAAAFNATTGNVRVVPYAAAYAGSALIAYSAGYAGNGPLAVDASLTRFLIGGTERMRLDSSGNLGLGVTPSGWSSVAMEIGYGGNALWGLSVNDFRLSTNLARISGGNQYKANGAAAMYNQASGGHYWYTAPSGTAGNAISFTQAMTLTAAGDLLVGTTSLGSLGVNSVSLAASSSVIRFTNTSASNKEWTIGTSTPGVAGVGDFLSVGRYSGSAWAEYARIDSSGNLLVGTTSNSINGNFGSGVSSNNTTGGTGVLFVHNTASSSADNAPCLALQKTMTTTSSSARFVQFYADNSGTPMGGIVGNGASNVQFASISDAREKTNIVPIIGSLEKVVALRPVEFDWIASGEHCPAGFVAQDVEQVFPEFVVENMANEGQETRKGLTGGMTGGIVAHLVKAIQEQQATITALTARVQALESN